MRLSLSVTIGFFITFSLALKGICQNQIEADSLKAILHKYDTLSPIDRAFILDRIAIHSSSPNEKLVHAELLLILAENEDLERYQAKAYQYLGVAYRLKGDLHNSLENLFTSAELAIEYDLYELLIEIYLEIATTYTTNDDFKNALAYQKKVIVIIRSHGNDDQLAINLLNTGYVYYTMDYLDSALLLYNEAEPVFERIDLKIGTAYTVGNRAMVYWKQGDYATAKHDLLKAISMLEPLGDQFGMADYHNQLGTIYMEQDEIEPAIYHTMKALAMAESLDLKQQIRDASLLLSELYERKGNHVEALAYQKQYIAYKDSIENTETTKRMADLRTAFEVSLKEKEIDLLENRQSLQRTYIIIVIILLLLSVVVLLYFRQRFLTARLLTAQERSAHNEKIKNLLNTQETKTLQAMVEGRDLEKRHLAQELHNHFGSLLATIKVNLNGIDKEAIHNYQTLTALVDQACDDVRNMSHELNMGISENFGLIPALKELTTYLNESGGVAVEFSAARCEGFLDSESEIIVYRIVQELLSNALKHAEATKLSVSLTCFEVEKLVNIMVHDDGKGFDPENGQIVKLQGMGLDSLKTMVREKEGEIIFDSQPGKGTTVTVDLPITTKTDLI